MTVLGKREATREKLERNGHEVVANEWSKFLSDFLKDKFMLAFTVSQ